MPQFLMISCIFTSFSSILDIGRWFFIGSKLWKFEYSHTLVLPIVFRSIFEFPSLVGLSFPLFPVFPPHFRRFYTWEDGFSLGVSVES